MTVFTCFHLHSSNHPEAYCSDLERILSMPGAQRAVNRAAGLTVSTPGQMTGSRLQSMSLRWINAFRRSICIGVRLQQLSNSFLWLLTLQGQIGSVVVFEYCSWFPSEWFWDILSVYIIIINYIYTRIYIYVVIPVSSIFPSERHPSVARHGLQPSLVIPTRTRCRPPRSAMESTDGEILIPSGYLT